MPRINQSVETMVMNDKGEMVSKRANTVMSWGDEPSYIKLYLQDIMYLSDMPKKYVAVTEALLKRIAYAGDEDGLCVSLLPRTKKAICDELGWKTVASLDNALQKLLAGKILYRVDRGMYRFNPYLFGKGDWQDISRLRLDINYDEIRGRTFKTNVEYKTDPNGQMYMDLKHTGNLRRVKHLPRTYRDTSGTEPRLSKSILTKSGNDEW